MSLAVQARLDRLVQYVAGYRLGEWGLIPSRTEISFFTTTSSLTLAPSIQYVQVGPSLGIKWP